MALKSPNYFFFLGGTDNEMEEIKKILRKKRIPFHQPQTDWGDIIISSLPEGYTSNYLYIFVECRPSPDFPARYKVIDHHGQFTHRKASLLQVCSYLKVKPNLRQQIIASIDSVFLTPTFRKFPQHRQLIWKTWESGYKKKFSDPKEYKSFKLLCTKQWLHAKKSSVLAPKTAIVWQAPASNTLISALADMEGWKCILIKGTPQTTHAVPILFSGSSQVVKRLSSQDLPQSYFGRRYFGCRYYPNDFLALIQPLL